MGLFLDYSLVPLPGIAERSEFTSDYTKQQNIVICSYVSVEKYYFATFGLPAT